MKPTLEDRKKTILGEGDAIQTKFENLSKQRDTLNRQLSQLQTRMTQLQGQLQLIDQQIIDRDAKEATKEKKK